MEGMKAYMCYMALKLHFTSNYDYFKYGGKTKAISESKFSTRKDYNHFRRIERRYGDQLENFLVANFILNSNAKWVGDLVTVEAEKKFLEWKKYSESLKYNIRNELSNISEDVKTLWNVENGSHPQFLKLYLGGSISLQTMIACDTVCNFLPHWKKEIRDTIIWPDVLRLMEKYRPFLKVEKDDIRKIMRETLLPLT